MIAALLAAIDNGDDLGVEGETKGLVSSAFSSAQDSELRTVSAVRLNKYSAAQPTSS